ncbi:MAG TPA: cupin domain-containing protein [Rhodanobacteraceae bacterium]|nr:cupin domain-containing protein [Rhodanobacteraceae bacterium]
MPPARFLRDYWQKRPLLVRGAFAGLRDPLEPDDLAGLACEELALARIAIHDSARDRWTVRSGPFAEADFATLPKTHWTLLVQDVDKWDADVAALLDAFAFLPTWRIDDVMASYAEDGGSVGPHVDQYDVFLLQGLGRRRWRISTDPAAPKTLRDDAELALLREFVPTHDWILESGDMLYLPPGVPHEGVAIGAAMTYSIGMRAPSQAELLLDLAATLAGTLPESQRYADPDLAPARAGGEIDAAALRRLLRALPWLRLSGDAEPDEGRAPDGTGGVDASLLGTWFGRFITRYRMAGDASPAARPMTDAALARLGARGAVLRRHPWSRFAWLRDGRAAMVFVAGEKHRCSLQLARRLCAHRAFPMSAAGTATRDLAVVRRLLDGGHLVPAGAGRGKAHP